MDEFIALITIKEKVSCMGRPRSDAVERFWSKVDCGDPDECWNWKAGVRSGYGEFWIDGRNVGAHVYSYTIEHGEVPDGFVVCHKCDNPRCVNPNHLFTGTYSDNTQDMISKGRLVRTRKPNGSYRTGSEQHSSKLTEEDVIAIREMYQKGENGHGVRILAKKYNVRPFSIYSIVNNLTWRKIKFTSN